VAEGVAMARALVTGAAGFVGANLCRTLLHAGHEVHAAVRPGSDRWRLAGISDDISIHEASLGDHGSLQTLMGASAPSWVFHLGAHGAYSWQTDVSRIFTVNAIGGAQLLELAVGADVESFVQAGSSSEYGFKDHAPGEREWLEPNSTYAVAKAAATHYARATALREDRHIVTLRLYSAYGPWEEPNRLMPALALHGLRGELPPLVDPRIARDYVQVDDVCEAFIAAAMRPDLPRGSVYNLASGVQTSLGELVALVRAELDVPAEPEWGAMAARTWDSDVWVGDPSLIAAELGWRADTSLADGIRGLAAWLAGDPGRRAHYEAELRSLQPDRR
jgi:nucleoside-diphosphate-sugar epimerase